MKEKENMIQFGVKTPDRKYRSVRSKTKLDDDFVAQVPAKKLKSEANNRPAKSDSAKSGQRLLQEIESVSLKQ